MVEFLKLLRTEAKLALLLRKRILRGQTHNGLLAVHRRQDRYTDIILMPVHDLGNTAVLRFSFLRDIHTADDLDTCHHRGKQTNTVSCFLVQSTVDTVTDAHLTLHGFYMYIGSTLSDSLLDHALDKLYDRGVVDVLAVEVFLLHHLAFFLSGVFFQSRIHFRLSVIPVDCQHDASGGRHHRFHLHIRDDINIIQCGNIHRIRHRHAQHHSFLRILKRQYLVFLEYISGHQLQDFLLDLHILQIDHVISELITQRSGNVLLRKVSFIYQYFSQLTACTLLSGKSLLQIFCGYDTAVDKHVPQTQLLPIDLHLKSHPLFFLRQAGALHSFLFYHKISRCAKKYSRVLGEDLHSLRIMHLSCNGITTHGSVVTGCQTFLSFPSPCRISYCTFLQ